jgi:hypothetical protein
MERTMQTASQTTTRNTIDAIASVMLEHPGKSDVEIRQIGNFTKRQFDQFGDAAAERAAALSAARN